MSWGWLANGRVWAGIALTAALAGALLTAYSLGGAADRIELANLRASHAEQGRVAALARAAEQERVREREAALQAQIDKEAHDGQERIDAAVAAAGRAGAAEQRVRNQFTAFRDAVRRSAASAEVAAPGTPAAAAAGVHADLLGELGARTERLALLAGIYARTADRAHAAGLTCQRSGDAMSAPAVSLFPE